MKYIIKVAFTCFITPTGLNSMMGQIFKPSSDNFNQEKALPNVPPLSTEFPTEPWEHQDSDYCAPLRSCFPFIISCDMAIVRIPHSTDEDS